MDINTNTDFEDSRELGEKKENSLRNFRKHSSQECKGNCLPLQQNWDIPEDGILIIKEEIKEEDDDIEICGEIRIMNKSESGHNGTPALLQQRPPQLLQFALSQPVNPEVDFTANQVLQQIEAQQSKEAPRSVPVILPQHNQQHNESIRSTAYLSYLNHSPSSPNKPNSPSYPQQRQGTHSAEHSPRRDSSHMTSKRQIIQNHPMPPMLNLRDGSQTSSNLQILSKPPMPNLIPIPSIGDASPSVIKSPPPYVEPIIRIVENPRENSLRFRYECEGRSAGSLQGITSTASNKTFPSIEILNYRGPAVVVVSCVNATGPPLTHPHNLVGKDCKKGVCTININNDSMFCMFHNLGVQCVRRKDVDKSLTQRQNIRVDPFKQGFQHKNSPNKIDLNAVRLCFQVFIIGQEGKFTKKLEPVLSTPVFDAKAKKDLQIIELADDNSSVDGGRKMLILCEKVAKDDIEVNFFEEDDEGNRTWEALGDFRPSDVHKQYGICLRTPRYRNRFITSTVRVNIELRKASNRTDTSDPLPFYFTPTTSPHPISPTSPFLQTQLSMVEVSNSISEEDLPDLTVLIPSHVSTASEDDVTRAVYNTSSSMRRQIIHRQNSSPVMRRQLIQNKMSRTDSTSTQGINDNLGVPPLKRMKV